MTGDVVCLRTAVNPAEAYLWQNLLKEADICANVVGDYLEAGVGDIPGARAELWVPRAQVQQAEDILNHHFPHHAVQENKG